MKIKTYKNATVTSFKNKRVIVMDMKEGVQLSFVRLDPKGEPVGTSTMCEEMMTFKGNVVTNSIIISKEAAHVLLNTLISYLNKETKNAS